MEQNVAALQELRSNGASRNRTGDLLGAIQALSHLSYSPVQRQAARSLEFSRDAVAGRRGISARGGDHLRRRK
jgi:hypothetical protein